MMVTIPFKISILEVPIIHPDIIIQIFIINTMDDNGKKKLVTVKKLIQQKKYQEALEDLEVMSYKYSKVFQIYLMMGLCYEKSNKDLQAQKAYLEVLDLNPNDSQALKQLCEIYNKRGDTQKGTKYLESMAQICKKSDPKKYRQAVVKLVDMYQKDLNMEKIDLLFQQYSKVQKSIGEDFVAIAKAYFKVGVTNQCFFLQKFEVMGVNGQQLRPIEAAAKEQMNRLLIEIVDYLRAIALNHNLSRKDIANSIMQLKMYFPECCSLLMLLLFDEYCVGQMAYSSYILGEVYYLCQGYFDQQQNYYHNIRYTSPQTFAVCMLLARQYLCFFKQFFTLESAFDPYYPKLIGIQDKLEGVAIREEYKKKIDHFILKQCRQLAQQGKHQNIQIKLHTMKIRIESLENSYLEEVIARIALHSFKNYDQLNDMKYKLKVRIKQIEDGEVVPHLYKYYYDYIIKMARIFKTLDQQIPISEVLDYIVKNDPKDCKYQLQLIWFQFSMKAKNIEQNQKVQIADQNIKKIKNIYEQLDFSLQSVALRRIIILKSFKGQKDLIQDIQTLLKLQRSFENLETAAFYHYLKGQHKEALSLVREAYRLNQNSYHTNRLFFLTLFKCGQIKQAYAFLEHIRSTFSGVFWVNYLLAIHKTNQHKFLEAQSLMIKALEAFQAGSQDNFRFYYEKVWDMGDFSLMYMIKQNQYSLFFDQLIIPEQFVFSQIKVLSNVYFEQDVNSSRMKLFYKQGQLLKILGRTKSSLNYLEDAYRQSLEIQIGIDSDPKLLFDHALVRKQYATLLFYSCQLRQAQQMLVSAFTIVQWMLAVDRWTLGVKLSDQIQALFFQISISRLSTLIKFQSQERISEYLQTFRKNMRIPQKKALTYLKNKYQFHILQFMHQRNEIDRVENSVKQFIQYFGLSFETRSQENFAIKLQQLKQEDRKFIRQCLEDYYIVRGLSKPPEQGQLFQMLTLFPRSSTLCVLFGSITADIKLQTASYLKVIQLDKQSTISMDILASLYLKQKNYLAASKLFLKSLQTDILNPKCYLGLAICLFCLVVRSVQQGDKNQVQIVRLSLSRINSYMQFIRLNDPFENYHLLSFLKLLLSDNPQSLFDNKLIMQSAYKNCLRYRDSLLGQLIQNASEYWKKLNIWKNNDQITMFQSYVSNIIKDGLNDHQSTSKALLQRGIKLTQQLSKAKGSLGKEIALKKFEKLLHEIGLCMNLALKSQKYDDQVLNLMIQTCQKWQASYQLWGFSTQVLEDLKRQIKEYLYEYLFLDTWKQDKILRIDSIFQQIKIYSYFTKHSNKIQNIYSKISKLLLKDPGNEQIRRIHQGYLTLKKGINLRKAKLSYQQQLQNNNNLSNIENQRTYKQLFMLYRDPQAILMYVTKLWNDCGDKNQKNIQKWIKLVSYVTSKCKKDKNDPKIQKARRLKLQMLAYLSVKYSKEIQVELEEQQKQDLKKLVSVYRIINLFQQNSSVKEELNKLSTLMNNPSNDFDWWVLMTLISFISRRVRVTVSFQKLLILLEQQVDQPKIKAFIQLTRFIQITNRSAASQQDLVNQIVDLTHLAQNCLGLVSPPTEVILQCTRAYLGGSTEEVEAELGRTQQMVRLNNYSDQILINFFQVLIQYKNAESNPNGEGVIEYFTYMADSMLMTVKQPLLQGFILSLKGMIESLSEGQGRSFRTAMLLAPSAAKNLVQSK